MTTATKPAKERPPRFVWEATPKQALFLSRTEDDVFFGGAKFGSKTDGLLAWCITRRQKYAKSRGLFIRRELAEVVKQGAAWDRIQEFCGSDCKYNQTDHIVYFPNGSVQEFGHCQNENDKFKYQGAQYDDIAYDQLEQFTESQATYINAACRVPASRNVTDAEGNKIKPRIRSTGNPGDTGHAWVKRTYVDPAKPGTPFTVEATITPPDGPPITVTRTRVFIPSLIFDNPHASPEYMAVLDALPEPYRSAYLYGLWDIFIGQAFQDFKPNKDGAPYHVIPTTEIPGHWRRAEGHDWGYAALMYTCWGAADPEGGIVIYKELAGRGWNNTEIAQRILEKRGADVVNVTYAGHDIFNDRQAAMNQETVQRMAEHGQLTNKIVQDYEKAGLLTCQMATTDRLSGKMRFHELFKERPDGVPLLRIMDSCPILIETLSQIQIDPKRSEDVITDYPADAVLRDDPYDGARYLIMGMVGVTKPMEPQKPRTTIQYRVMN